MPTHAPTCSFLARALAGMLACSLPRLAAAQPLPIRRRRADRPRLPVWRWSHRSPLRPRGPLPRRRQGRRPSSSCSSSARTAPSDPQPPKAPTSPSSALPRRPHAPRHFDAASRGGRPVAARIKIAITFRAPVVTEAPLEPDPSPDLVHVPGAAAPSAPARNTAAAERPDEVRVRGAREPSRTVSLSRAEVRQIPGAFGDPFRGRDHARVTPIVSGFRSSSSAALLRATSAITSTASRIPLLFHVGAGPSVVHPGLIQRVDLYPGGYPARLRSLQRRHHLRRPRRHSSDRTASLQRRLFVPARHRDTRWPEEPRLGPRRRAIRTPRSCSAQIGVGHAARSPGPSTATYDLTPDVHRRLCVRVLHCPRPNPTDITLGTEFHRVDSL